MVSPAYQPEPELQGFVDVLAETVKDLPKQGIADGQSSETRSKVVQQLMEADQRRKTEMGAIKVAYQKNGWKPGEPWKPIPISDENQIRTAQCNITPDSYAKLRMASKHTKLTMTAITGFLVQVAIQDGWLDEILACVEVDRLRRQYGDKWELIKEAIKQRE